MAIFILRPKNADVVEVLAPDCFLGHNFTKKEKNKNRKSYSKMSKETGNF